MMYALRQMTLFKNADTSAILGYIRAGDLVEYLDPVGDAVFAFVRWCNKFGYVLREYLADFEPVFERRLFTPADEQIGAAVLAGRASQYIDIRAAGGRKAFNLNLCGQFCAAQLAQMDVTPLCMAYLGSIRRASDILGNDKPTGAGDVRDMLLSVRMTGYIFRVGVDAPLYPVGWDDFLPAVIGVGIDAMGMIRAGGVTRHWVVLHEIKRQANTAWALVYNPYWNRAETVLWGDLTVSGQAVGMVKGTGG